MRPSIALLLFAQLVISGACSEAAEQRGHDVLLITLDTTRYNALGCMGNPRQPTPNLDRLAAEGVLYERARSVTPLTVPAHASMLTGLYPPRHTVYGNGVHPLPRSARTVAELARAEGVQTAAFVASIALDPSFGLDQGFEVYAAVEHGSDPTAPRIEEIKAPDVVASAQSWLAGRDRSRPFFAWLHLFDAHDPYEPPPELAAAMKSGYLGEVAFMDRSLGGLFDALRSDGTLDETLLIVVGDHGEGLGQHGEPTHGWFCYDGTLRVPMFVRYPDGWRKGERSRENVSVVDVFPTILSALGVEVPAGIDGHDLYRELVPPERGIYFECFNGFENFGWSPLVGWVDSRGKYIHSSAPEFYDVEGDKLEARNLVAERSADVQSILGEIRRVRARPALVRDESEQVDPEAQRALRGLGYVDMGGSAGTLPDPLAPTTRPSPSTRREELGLFQRASQASRTQQVDSALELWTQLLARYPENLAARSYMASDLIKLGRTQEAAAALEQVSRSRGLTANEWNSLGWCREQAGDLDGARAAYGAALEIDPAQPFARGNLERVTGK